MVTQEEKKTNLYKRILTILYSTMPPADKLRAILEMCNEADKEDQDDISE